MKMSVARLSAVLALAALGAALAPASGRAQQNRSSPTVEDHLRQILVDRPEAQVRVSGNPALIEPFVVLHPRVDRGLLVGEVRTGSVGDAALFESRAFPLDQVRELRVKENRFWTGALYGAFAGVALSGALQLKCSRASECGGGMVGNPAFYALATSALAGIGGGIAFYATGWRVVYTFTPGAVRIAQGPAAPAR